MAALKLFRETLFFPFQLPESFAAAEVGHPWQPIEAAPGPVSPLRYAGMVYFHPFARRFLYPPPSERAPVSAYRRQDIDGVRFWWTEGADNRKLQGRLGVFSTTLHLFADCGVGLVAVEVGWDDQQPPLVERDGQPLKPMGLAEAQEVLDRLRRLYPPYWSPCAPATGPSLPGHCFHEVEWLQGEQPVGQRGEFQRAKEYLHALTAEQQPAIAAHWRTLLQPFEFAAHGPLAVTMLGDERLPLMAWLAVDDPQALSRGDFVRLAFADESGSSHTLPAARNFLGSFEQQHCYDRFWDAESAWMHTRYLCSGYGFLAVGKDDRNKEDSNKNGFFTHAETGALAHFRHHYFKIGLTVHLQRAALLAFSEQLAAAVATHGNDSAALAGAVRKIRLKLLHFTHRYWFSEITGQMQGQELYRWWVGHLGSQALYDKLHGELEKIDSFLNARAQEEQAKRMEEQGRRVEEMSSRTEQLTWVAAAALTPALAAAILGMNGFKPTQDLFKAGLGELGRLGLPKVGIGGDVIAILLALIGAMATIALFFRFFRWLLGRSQKTRSRTRSSEDRSNADDPA